MITKTTKKTNPAAKYHKYRNSLLEEDNEFLCPVGARVGVPVRQVPQVTGQHAMSVAYLLQ
jgi:hypothetical protein